MLGKQHAEFAVITTAALYITLKDSSLEVFNYPAIVLATGLLGGLFPDIDHPVSIIGQIFPIASNITSKLFGHRTITHDLCITGILTIISMILFPYTIPFWFGYMGHLFLDSMTINGIWFLYPINKKYLKKKKIWELGLKNGIIRLFPTRYSFRSNQRSAKYISHLAAFLVSFIIITIPYIGKLDAIYQVLNFIY